MRPLITILLILTALTAVSEISAAQPDTVSILFTGDTSGKLKPGRNGHGGYARRITVLERARQHTEASVTVDIGNFLSPDYLVLKSAGRAAVTCAAMAGYDVIAPGRHDFDYGTETLLRRAVELDEAAIALVNANILTTSNVPLLAPYAERTVTAGGGDRRLLFIGVIDPALLERRLGPDLIVRTPERALELYLDEVRDRHYDAVVCLAHLGRDYAMRLAERFPRINAFVCLGNERDPGLRTALITDLSRRKQSLIVNAVRDGGTVGELRIALPADGADAPAYAVRGLPVADSVPPHPQAEQFIFMEDTQADFPVFTLTGAQNDADSLITLLLAHIKHVTRSEVAVLPRGMFDATCLPFADNTLTYNDLYQFIPTGDRLVRLKLTGSQVASLVRRGAAGNRHRPEYLYCDGYDRRTGTINGKMPYGSDRYSVVTSSFLAAGGAGYGVLDNGAAYRDRFVPDGEYLVPSADGRPVELRNDLFIPGLIHWRTADKARFTDLSRRPLWRLSLNSLGMSARQSWWNGDASGYDEVPNFPTRDLQHVESNVTVTAERVTASGRWKNEFVLEYGRERYAGTDIYDDPDDAVVTSRFEYPSLLKRPGMLQTLYPFLQLKFDSEVTPPEDTPRELDAYADLGLGVGAGRFTDIRLSLGAVRDLSVDSALTSFSVGATAAFSTALPIVSAVSYDAELVYAGKLRTGYDEHRLTCEHRFDIPLIKNLSLRTGVTWYAYRDSGRNRWAAAGEGNVMLNYSFTARWQRM